MFFDLCPPGFKIQVSPDNIKWVDVVTVEEYSSPPSYSTTWDFDPTKARYIKWVITKGRPFLFTFYLSYLSEIEVSGCSASESEAPSALQAATFTHTQPERLKLLPDMEMTDKKNPLQAPGRPGRPVFLHNNNF